MKILKSIGIIAATGILFVSCQKKEPIASETQQVTTTETGDAYKVDSATSKIEWKGYKIAKTESMSHFGVIKFTDGQLTIKDGKLESGKFTANMNSITSLDLKDDPMLQEKLGGHLKSPDFFDVAQFPAATYEITKISEGTGDFNTALEGNLTIKGITKPFQVNANVNVADGKVTLATEPKDIDRTQFGVQFQMPVKDGLIKNEVTIQVYIEAKK